MSEFQSKLPFTRSAELETLVRCSFSWLGRSQILKPLPEVGASGSAPAS